MVALRGKKTSVPAAKPKAVEKAVAAHAKGGKAAGKDETAAALARAQQQKLARHKEEEFLGFLRFVVQASLAKRDAIPQGQTVGTFCSALLTALCGTGKDRHLAPSQILAKLTRAARKRVCGAVFSADEIAYSCRNCQLDATCVTCKDCFMHSDHAGHDVYFQRTTAGSSCDCGDPHAWKQSGFCSKHQGMDSAESSSARKYRLPKSIGLVAPVVIDAVVEHAYQVLLGIHYGFELAEAFELFTRNIPAEFLPIHAQSDLAVEDDEAARQSAERVSSARSSRSSDSRAGASGSNSSATNRKTATSTDSVNSDDAPAPFAIRLHNDDCHTPNEVINHLCVAMDFSKLSARAITDQTDRFGDSVLSRRALLKCPLVVGNLVRRSLNVSVVPDWLESQIPSLADVFEWLQTVSSSSDGLGELVSEALSKRRSKSFRSYGSFSCDSTKGRTVSQFAKECGVRLHQRAASLLGAVLGEDTPVDTWLADAERSRLQNFKLWGSDDSQPSELSISPSATTTHNIGELGCNNVFIEEFVKATSLSGAYTRHASVREGFNAVVSKYFVAADSVDGSRGVESSEPLSALTLLVQYDCTLRKNAADRLHSLLREHLLEIDFRTSLLQSYMQCYQRITDMFLRGLGNSSESIFDFAVQFLTVPHLVQGYTRAEASKHADRRQIIGELLAALKMVFKSAIDPKTGALNPEHSSLSNQKYKHCIENMEYVFNVGTFSRELVCDPDNMKLWLECLAIIQGGDPQVRRGVNQSHVEYESDSWLPMFNLGIRVHSVFSLSWNGFKADQLQQAGLALADVFKPVLDAAIASSASMNEKVATKKLIAVPQLPGATAQSANGLLEKSIVSYRFNVAADPTSLHIPLHRYLSATIRQITVFHAGFQSSIQSSGLLRAFGFEGLSAEAKQELIEMPLRCLVMASQIHSGLWRRNGDENMLAQLYNYSALPYCVHYRDADVFMMQLGVLMTGPDDVVARMMDHYQLGSYFAVSNSGDQGSPSASENFSATFGYSRLEKGIDDQQRLQMLEEFLRLVIIIGTALPASAGTAYENEFLLEEMLQQLCSKPQSFSKLFELAIMPSGQDDIPVARLEAALGKVAEFVPPSGLEPGRYELKDDLLERYNPYFLHLNRESHELARDRWTSFRNVRRRKTERENVGAGSESQHPHEPLRAAARPLEFLRPVQSILMCDSTLSVVQVILWRVLSAENLSSSDVVSDAVISTSLHLLVHGVHTAVGSENMDDGATFWRRLCKCDPALDNYSILHLLSILLEKATTLLDGEQTGTLEWLIWKINLSSPMCSALFKEIANKKAAEAAASDAAGSATTTSSGGDAAAAVPLTLEQRKEQARARALAAMAQKQAAFQAMMANFEEKEDEEHKEGDDDDIDHDDGGDDEPRTADRRSVRKRRGNSTSEHEGTASKKRKKVADATDDEDASGPKCILCHDSHEAGQMGMAAYLHQSTVLATGFRPDPHEALDMSGKRVRAQVKEVIAKMELCSGSTATSDPMSPLLRAFTAPPLPEWYVSAGNGDDGMPRDGSPARTSPRMTGIMAMPGAGAPVPGALPRRHRHERIRFGGGNLPMIQGELLQTDEDLDVLEGVLDMDEDQRLFGLDFRGGVGGGEGANARVNRPPRPMLARRGGRVARAGRRFDPRQNMRVIFDDSEDDDEDEDSAFEASFQRSVFGAVFNQHNHHHHGHHPPGFDDSIHNSSQLYLTPCGLHIRTCQHAVHIDCLERYITSLHDKAIRGEDFDGVQAIDPDSAMTQFLCPLCKTLSNFLMPMSMPVGGRGGAKRGDGDNTKAKKKHADDEDMPSEYEEKREVAVKTTPSEEKTSSSWLYTIKQQLEFPGWCRTVLGRDDTSVIDLDHMDEHNMWREYFEETLWEPHGSLEKGAPFLWSACGFTLASFLLVAEDEHRNVSGSSALPFDPLVDRCPPSLEKELESLVAVTKFCRWSFLMLEHSADAKVIWETSKRCCPINCETKREYRKFTNVLGSVDPCLRGTILGLLVADSFTAFVVSTVVAADPATIWQIMPVFSVADLVQRFYVEFFQQRKADETSLFQDKYTAERDAAKAAATTPTAGTKKATSVSAPSSAVAASDDTDVEVRRTRSGRIIGGPSPTDASSSRARSRPHKRDDSASAASAAETIFHLMDAVDEGSDEYAALAVLKRMAAASSADKNPLVLEPLSADTLSARLATVLRENATFVRRMKLFWRCLAYDEDFAHAFAAETLEIPTLSEIARCPDAVFDQIWRWCDDRMTSKSYLGVARSSGGSGDHGDRCEHTEGCSEAYVASMFILREVPRKPQLIDLPIQYDELYSALSGRTCDRCGRTPSDPGVCLVCGEFLCCGDSCCTRAFIAHGPPVGECTRHAAECGGGVGIVLLLDQCRVAIIGGSMAAHFPSPYVDAHGEEDVGLQRGRPLRLDMARYRHLEALWLQHRLFSEVSRQRNQRDPQYTINLSYL